MAIFLHVSYTAYRTFNQQGVFVDVTETYACLFPLILLSNPRASLIRV